jgi:hypothetical protein
MVRRVTTFDQARPWGSPHWDPNPVGIPSKNATKAASSKKMRKIFMDKNHILLDHDF